MATLRHVAALAIATSACVQQQYSDPSTMPEPTVVYGPPGGEMDPDWQPRSSGDYADATVVEPSSDPEDPGYAMGMVTDAEIDMTLDGYGEWIETDDYGRVWRPYATEVGVDFTPYESCGSWIWTDWGWSFTCDWDWGWLPFHYGNWGWFDDYWAWVPDYTWTPAAVDWRGGSGYVGWRPTAPTIRDHRGEHIGPTIRDHRSEGPIVRDHRTAKQMDSHWRFAAETDFGRPHIRAHLFKEPARGLRLTQAQARPQLRGRVQAIRAASLMRTRFAKHQVRPQIGTRFDRTRPARPMRPAFDRSRPPVYDRNPARSRAYDRAFSSSQPSVYAPTYTPQAPTYTRPSRGGRDLDRAPDANRAAPAQQLPPRYRNRSDRPVQATPTTPPVWSGQRPPITPTTPIAPSNDSPIRTYTPPTRPMPTYTPQTPPSRPTPTYSPPSRSTPTYSPSRSAPTYSPPRSTPTYSPPPASRGGWGGARRH
ncbi:MAG: hypothetical protein HOV81_17400, partial [Kofleriaceae bacterium]|nr:hypothetical protein [Kofleriaceae bacterium]